MVNRDSALITNYKTCSIKVNEQIKLTFKEIKDLNIQQIASWPTTLESIDSKLSKMINLLTQIGNM